jgi:hypothetical protein
MRYRLGSSLACVQEVAHPNRHYVLAVGDASSRRGPPQMHGAVIYENPSSTLTIIIV